MTRSERTLAAVAVMGAVAAAALDHRVAETAAYVCALAAAVAVALREGA